MLARQAKTLSSGQVKAVMAFLEQTRHSSRNRVIFLLSLRAGLRAKEIASLTWAMITDAEGQLDDTIRLTDHASKGKTGGAIPMARELREALSAYHADIDRPPPSAHVIGTERSNRTSAQAIINMMGGWYRNLGFDGCSSHSGRRTFITNAARNISRVGGSLRDVQALARHASLSTTQRYIEINNQATRAVVDL